MPWSAPSTICSRSASPAIVASGPPCPRNVPPPAAAASTPDPEGGNRPPDITLLDLAQHYQAERRVAGKTYDELVQTVKRFGEVAGADRPVCSIGRGSVGRFKTLMLAKPAADLPPRTGPSAMRGRPGYGGDGHGREAEYAGADRGQAVAG